MGRRGRNFTTAEEIKPSTRCLCLQRLQVINQSNKGYKINLMVFQPKKQSITPPPLPSDFYTSSGHKFTKRKGWWAKKKHFSAARKKKLASCRCLPARLRAGCRGSWGCSGPGAGPGSPSHSRPGAKRGARSPGPGWVGLRYRSCVHPFLSTRRHPLHTNNTGDINAERGKMDQCGDLF